MQKSTWELFSCPGFNFIFENTRVYNLISVPQITRLSLEDAIISSKTELRSGEGEGEAMVMLEIIRQC